MEIATNINYFNVLSKIDFGKAVEEKNKLKYLSWAHAWDKVKSIYPSAHYQIYKFDNNLPYVYDEKTGYMVFTSVTLESITHEMWLPVMDAINNPMKDKSYSYFVDDYKWINGKRVNLGTKTEKFVEPASMFDINKTIMRCLTKNLAMHGVGLYIYAGEDLPRSDNNEESLPEESKVIISPISPLDQLKTIFNRKQKTIPEDYKARCLEIIKSEKEKDIINCINWLEKI